jgi:signal transduction histidine kinase
MKIKTQSFILIAGIALMPVLVVSFSIVIARASFSAREAARFEEYQTERRLGISPSEDEIVARMVEQRPPEIEMAIAGPDGRVRYSTIASIPKGAVLSELLASAEEAAKRDKRLLVLGFGPRAPRGYLLVASMDKNSFLPSKDLRRFLIVGLAAMAAILAFAAVMSILIVRSITRSVLSLEAATKRVAEGELDTPISVEGSNEIASLSRSLNSLREQIKEDQARQSRFIMGISHDLKTPLALVKGYTEAIEGEIEGTELAGTGKTASYLGIIEAKADQLEGMIDDLIDFMRVDTGEWSSGLREVEIGPFLGSFLKRVEADANLLGREARGKIELPAGLFVKMDERLATRALENLVFNGLRYTREGGVVSVDAAVEGGLLRIVVSDNGPGIAAEDIAHIFEPFYRGTSSRREQGMGLGLSIVKTVVESHGWSIGVASEAGGGVAFTIGIPLEESKTR